MEVRNVKNQSWKLKWYNLFSGDGLVCSRPAVAHDISSFLAQKDYDQRRGSWVTSLNTGATVVYEDMLDMIISPLNKS